MKDAGIDESYELKKSDDGMGNISYYYEKVDKNGVHNMYDALNAVFSGENGSLVMFKRFYGAAFYEPKISESKAIEKAGELYPNAEISKNNLTYHTDNDNEVRLAFEVKFDCGAIVYIDAVTGKVIFTDSVK